MHGGFIYAFASNLDEPRKKTTQIEISILDLPSVSGTTNINALPLERMTQKEISSIHANNDNQASRPKTTSQKERSTIANAPESKVTKLSEISEAKTSPPLETNNIIHPKAAEKTLKQSVSVLKIAAAPLQNKLKQSAPVENRQTADVVTSSQVIEMRIPDTKLIESNNNQKIVAPAKTALPAKIKKNKRVALLAKTSPIKSTGKNVTVIAQTVTHSTSIKKISPPPQTHDKLPVTVTKKLDNPAKTSTKVKVFSSVSTFKSKISAKQPAARSRTKIQSSDKFERASKINSPKPVTAVTPLLQKNISSNLLTVNIPTKKLTKNSPIRIGAVKRLRVYESAAKSPRISMTATQVATIARPNQIQSALRPAPTKKQAEDFAKVIRFLKFNQSENRCFLALPNVSKQERMEIIGFSNETSSWLAFQNKVKKNTRFDIPGQLISISDAQCQVIAFARQNKSYPSFTVSMEITKRIITNGGFVSGTLFINEGRYLNLYLVDDEGTAININQFVKIETNTSTFQFQVNLTSGAVKTSQLLLAIVTDKLLVSTVPTAPISAQKLLNEVQLESIEKKLRVDLAISSFLVK